MPPLRSFGTSKNNIVPALLTLLAAGVLTAFAGDRLRRFADSSPAKSSAPAPAPAAAAAAEQSPPPAGARRVVRVTIRPTGFDPAELTLGVGRFVLAVDNRSGLEEVSLALTAESGPRVHEARVHRDRLDWRSEVNLPPGRYTLTEADHPEWACRIAVGEN